MKYAKKVFGAFNEIEILNKKSIQKIINKFYEGTL